MSQDSDRSDRALQQAHSELEERVAERTAQLSEAVARLEAEVAERRKVERALAHEKERLAVTLRSIGEGFISADVDGVIHFMSEAAERLTGWPASEALGRKLDTVWNAWESEGGQRDDPLARLSDSPSQEFKPSRLRLVARDGTERLISETTAPIADGEGVALVFHDITLEKRLEEEAQKAQKLESLGTLAGGLAHDFNNLLTVILGNVNLAQRYVSQRFKEVGSREAVVLGAAHEACLRARGLTKQLLTFASGGAPVKKTGSIVDLLRGSVEFALHGSNVKAEFEISDDLHAVEMDVGQINSVVNSLINNAVQSMPEGGTVHVRARNSAAAAAEGGAPPSVVVEIEDHGHGIPEDNLEKIFDPYFTTKGKEGTGLGLSMAYKIVREHGGKIGVASRAGEGTTFAIHLPAVETAAPAVPMKKRRPAARAAGGHILLMDDDEDVRSSVVRMLKILGHRVDVASHGEEAIELYTRAHGSDDPFTAVILDLTIPGGMGGKDVIPRLRALDPSVKAIVASGYSIDPVMSQHQRHGFQAVIEKPFDVNELNQVLGELMAK